MIQITSYQVYDNCVGGCVVPQVKCDYTAQSQNSLDEIRKEIRQKHKDDVIAYRAQHQQQHSKLTDSESRKAITIYFTYTEK